MRLHAAVLTIFLASARCLAGDGPRDAAELIRPVRQKHDLPAMAGAIVTGAGLEAVGVDGVRERGRPEKVTTLDRWHLGSCTKSMTASLCAMLVEEKKLAWDTTVGSVFGEVPGVDPAWKPVTLEQLLTNHAGAPATLDAEGLWGRLRRLESPPAEQRRVLVEGVLRRPPEAPPGSKYIYSNAGFSIAGAIAETVAKEPWERLIVRRLFEPLGMKSAGFGAPGTKDALDEPRGHHESGRPVPPGRGADNPAAIGPAGIVHSSIGDWAKYVRLHLVGEKPGSTDLLPPAAFAKLHTPVPDASNYAMGWIVTQRPWAGGRVLTHSGSNTMWYCATWIAPGRDFAVLATCNQGGAAAAKAVDELCAALIEDHVRRAGAAAK